MKSAVREGLLPLVGLLATDELRIQGLRAILGDGSTCLLSVLSTPKALSSAPVDVLLIDGSTTERLQEMLSSFRKARPRMRILVLGEDEDFGHIQRVIAAGAKGYVSLSAPESELKSALAVVLDDSIWAPRKVLARLLEEAGVERTLIAPAEIECTPRETEVLKLLMLGHSNREIAQALKVDEGTIKAHLGRLMRKAGVRNRTALTMRMALMIPQG